MKHRHLAPLGYALATAVILAACQGSRESPTEPASPAMATASATSGAAATSGSSTSGAPTAEPARSTTAATTQHGGNGGGGGGNGNGHGHGGDGGSGNPGSHGGHDLSLSIDPAVWNTNFAHADGTVSALVRGADVAKIDTSTVVLVGDGGKQVQPTRVQTSGGQLRAFFTMSDALASLDGPDPGETHQVKLTFSVAGTATALTASVRIVGPPTGSGGGGGGEVELEIQPDHWSVEWSHSQGTVSALLRGDVGAIALDSIVLVGDSGKQVQPLDVKRVGHQVRARFAKPDALASLTNPKPGDSPQVKVTFTSGGASKTLTAKVRIVGPDHDH